MNAIELAAADASLTRSLLPLSKVGAPALDVDAQTGLSVVTGVPVPVV